ncbi:DoxX family protein [Alphaproteobacteria bacterium]|jgi:putative oxidoreductase|nr:DoxX family protein [Alphaproteobacteria bacterium]MDB9871715.1 DoxX family protein [Alphaproteobacteria bacterium]|tara:strand:+ start:1116 stop:1520 length:405 start_codon:yes stop_codon:yes gene_type:complete
MIKNNKIFLIIETLSAPLGRLLISFMFLMSGLNKAGNYSNTSGWMESMGVSSSILPLVILLEIIGAFAIIVGWHTKITAFLLAGFSIISALIFHSDFSNQVEMIMFMKNFAIAGGFLILVANGAGNYSLDNRKK